MLPTTNSVSFCRSVSDSLPTFGWPPSACAASFILFTNRSVSFGTACEKAGVAANERAVIMAGTQKKGRTDWVFMVYLEMLEVVADRQNLQATGFGRNLTCGDAKANCGGVKIDAIWGRRGAGDFKRSGRPSGMPATRGKPTESD